MHLHLCLKRCKLRPFVTRSPCPDTTSTFSPFTALCWLLFHKKKKTWNDSAAPLLHYASDYGPAAVWRGNKRAVTSRFSHACTFFSKSLVKTSSISNSGSWNESKKTEFITFLCLTEKEMVVNMLLTLVTVHPFTIYYKLVTTVEALVPFYITSIKRQTVQATHYNFLRKKSNNTAINGQCRQTNSTDHIWPTPEALFSRCLGFLLVFINI